MLQEIWIRKENLSVHNIYSQGRRVLSGVWHNRSRLMEVGVHEIDVEPYMPQISRGPGKYTPSARIWTQFARDLVLS